MELIKKHRAATRTSSRKKKPRTDQGWDDFLSALSAKEDGELSDFGLQQHYELHLKPEQIFFALNITTPDALHYDSDKGKLEKIDVTKKIPCTDLQSVETPTLEIQEAQIKDAMLQYHQTTFLPNHRFMLCDYELANNFTQTPSSSSTKPRFKYGLNGPQNQDHQGQACQQISPTSRTTSRWIHQEQPRLEPQILL